MKRTALILSIFLLHQSCNHYTSTGKLKQRIVWQPSHQTDTGKDFSEAATCNAIVESAMAMEPSLKEYKVWSLGKEQYHHADSGSNTKILHTTAVIDGKISGYAYELEQSNKRNPQVFIAVHNNGGTKRHAVWGYIHYGDKYEAANRELAGRLVKAICTATNMENRGVLLDSTTGRNDYRCAATGKLSFYSLDENINTAPYRVLLEIGDNAASHDFLQNPANQKIIGEAIKKELVAWLGEKH
ncbi:MAG: N-acetylmuramoyl-L-alanine amidase [Chitinophagaceae bacterium]